jgi:hypothetical protein
MCDGHRGRIKNGWWFVGCEDCGEDSQDQKTTTPRVALQKYQLCYGAAMPNEKGLFGRLPRVVRGYQHFDTRAKRQDLLAITKGLSEQAEKYKAKHIILLDRSARPLATALLEYWRLSGNSKSRPEILFLNPDGFSSKSLGISLIRVGFSSAALSIGEIRKPLTHSDERAMQNSFKSKFPDLFESRHSPVIVFDTCLHTGGTLDSVVQALEKIGFSNLKVGVASKEGKFEDTRTRVDFSFDEVRECETCLPFGHETLVKKGKSIVCTPVSKGAVAFTDNGDGNARRQGASLRSEIREIVGKSFKGKK